MLGTTMANPIYKLNSLKFMSFGSNWLETSIQDLKKKWLYEK